MPISNVVFHRVYVQAARTMGCASSRQAALEAANRPLDPIFPPADAPVVQGQADPGLTRALSNRSRMSKETAQKWLLVKARKPGAKARFICLAWAGSSANVFNSWQVKDAEIVAVELPARNARFKEKGLADVELVAKRVAEAIDAMSYLESRIPLVIFGHSFGAMLGVSIARILEKDYNNVPKLLVFAGCRPLHLWGKTDYYREDDQEMVQSMVDCGGMTTEMARDQSLIARVLPAIKADHLAMDRYVLNKEGGPLKAPILYLGGDADPRAPVDLVKDWQVYTSEPLQVETFRGGHFFIQESQTQVCAFLAKTIAGWQVW